MRHGRFSRAQVKCIEKEGRAYDKKSYVQYTLRAYQSSRPITSQGCERTLGLGMTREATEETAEQTFITELHNSRCHRLLSTLEHQVHNTAAFLTYHSVKSTAAALGYGCLLSASGTC